MKERPLNFDFEDGKKVEVTDEQKKKLEKSTKDLKQTISMLLYLIKDDSLNEGTRDAMMLLLDHNTQDICNIFDYGTHLKKQQEKTQKEIREVDLENRELRQQLGQKVSTEDVREKMKLVIYGFEHWAKTKGFGWMSDVQVNNWGTLSGKMRTRISRMDSRDKETRQRMADFGFEFEDIYQDYASPIANDHNLQKIHELVKTLSPDAIADEVIVNRRGNIPHMESVEIILPEWDCLDPYIQAYIEEEQKSFKKNAE